MNKMKTELAIPELEEVGDDEWKYFYYFWNLI